jgi:tRNA threonylcarbamoyladenosine biosynthesis protein TsaE
LPAAAKRGYVAAMSLTPARDSHRLALPDENATLALGARLAGDLALGQALMLSGGLGAGKTTLARGLIAAWTGVEEDAPSPTYTLVQTYDGPKGPLWHVDLYRLDDPDAAFELGLEDAFAEALCVIEWPERLGPYRPVDRLDIHLAPDGAGRIADCAGHGRLKEWRP